MVKTRKTDGMDLFCVPVGTDLPLSIINILYYGKGGQLFPDTPPTEQIRLPTPPTENEEVTKLNQHSIQEESVSHEPSILPPSDEGRPESLQTTPFKYHGIIMISEKKLKTLIEENIECKPCA